ncbi:MAG: Cys-tRNA(Pro) deacylase, partial [Ruminococcaceae bacterium]|nr:Cys-tRNA(Pro) deacylase [Oscillospiraceae bacterium]
KQYPTFIDETAELYDKIAISAGARGCQLILSPQHLMEYVGAQPCDIAR